MSASPRFTLVVGGSAWRNWTQVELVADFTTPVDAWSVSASNPSRLNLAALSEGSAVQVLVDEQVALRGTLERIEIQHRADGLTVSLSGRDLAAALVDCTPAPNKRAWRNLSLAAVARSWLAELGLAATVNASAEAHVAQGWHVAEPGESYWSVLERYCERLRLMPWMSPAGVLHLGRPDYVSPPVAKLVHNRALAAGLDRNNVVEARYVSDISQRFSRFTVLGTAEGSGGSLFGPDVVHLQGTATDAELVARGVNRPLVREGGALNSSTAARQQAEWEVSQRLFEGRQLHYTVVGTGPKPGSLWEPNQQVWVEDDVNNTTGTWWVAGRALMQSRTGGSRTRLDLREPHTLLPPA